jgi:hypothetical protein
MNAVSGRGRCSRQRSRNLINASNISDRCHARYIVGILTYFLRMFGHDLYRDKMSAPLPRLSPTCSRIVVEILRTRALPEDSSGKRSGIWATLPVNTWLFLVVETRHTRRRQIDLVHPLQVQAGRHSEASRGSRCKKRWYTCVVEKDCGSCSGRHGIANRPRCKPS